VTATLTPPTTSAVGPATGAVGRGRGRLPGPSVVGPAVASGVAVLLSSLALVPLFANGGWFGATLLVVIAVTAAGAVATWLRAPLFLVPIIQAAVLFGALVSRFTDEVAPWDVVPTPDALEALRTAFADGLAAVDRYAPPVPVSEGLTALVALGVGCVALAVFVLHVSLRVPTAAGIPLVALYVVPSFVLPDGTPWWAFVAVCAAWLILLVADERLNLVAWGRMLRRPDRRSTASPLAGVSSAALRLGAAAVVTALALPVLVPGLADAVIGRVTGGGGGTGEGTGEGEALPEEVTIDPFVSLRRDLTNNQPVPVLRYRTSADTDGYIRLVVNEAFDGETWAPNQFSTNTAVPAADGPLTPVVRAPGVDARSIRYDFVSMRLVANYLPTPENLTEVRAEGDWFVDSATASVFGEDGERLRRGSQWVAFGDEVRPTAKQLNEAPDIPAQQQADLLEGTIIPPALAERARQVILGTGTKHEAAVAIQDWLRNNFTYSTNVISRPVDSLQSSTYLEQFLEDKVGYCEQFAATMALMSRAIGIPARVVVGFTPGSRNDDGEFVVTAKDAHAWPELFFTGIGWVRFEPTPRGAADGGSVTVPGWAAPAPSTGEDRRGETSREGVPNNRQVPDEESGTPNAISEVPTAETPEDVADTWRRRGLALLLLAGVVALLVPAGRRLVRRRRRLSASASVEDAWEELRDSARDLGVPWSDAHTPRQAAAAVIRRQSLMGEAADATNRLARTTEQVRYAPRPPVAEHVADDVRAVRGALWRRAEWKARVRAVLWPASLRRAAP
jgi:transglutaminase-like putative cysteine protease